MRSHVSVPESGGEYYTFDELFEIREEKLDPETLQGRFRYCQIGDVSKTGEVAPVTLNFEERGLTEESYYKKIEKGDILSVAENDILISFLLPQDPAAAGKLLRITAETADIYFTDAFLRITPRRMPVVLYYCLKGIFYRDLAAAARIRKGYTGYATLDAADLRRVRFDRRTIDRLWEHSEALTARLTALERRIAEVQAGLLSEEEMINAVFRQELSWDWETFRQLQSVRQWQIPPAALAGNPDLRFSPKFHRQAGAFVLRELRGITDRKLKHFLAEPIALGASIAPADYAEEGTTRYISMATIRSWHYREEDASFVTEAFAAAKAGKTVQKDDILMARSGEGTIGKAAWVESGEVQGVFADFIMRIRLRNVEPEFAWCYFRSAYFQYLIEIYKKGLGNNTNIFPIALQEFPMPDFSPNRQRRMLEEVHGEMAARTAAQAEISRLRAEMESCVRQAAFGT